MRHALIRAVLDCGVDDLSMLDDSGADMFKVVEQMRFEGLEITLNGIMAEIFREGIFRMSEAVKETRKRLEDEEDAGTLTEAGYEKALENQGNQYIHIRNHARVIAGNLKYDHTDKDL